MGRIQWALAGMALAAFSSPGTAAIRTYKFDLSGAQEVPSVATSATGECLVTLDDVLNQVSVSCTYSGLTSNANNAHIHTGAPGVSGPPVVTLAFTAATSGTATVTNGAISPANVAAMIAGNTYVNIHSMNHSGGEIRGQVVGLVPAASTWGLIALAVLVLTGGTLALRKQIAPTS